MLNLGEKIKNLRKENNLSQEQLAEKLNISRQAISKWESGKAYPDIENLKVLKNIFNITIDELVMDEIPSTNLKENIEINTNKENTEITADENLEEDDDLPTKLMFIGFMIGMGVGFITDNYVFGTAACFIGLGVGELIEYIKAYKK